jgi:hypothetical protein
MLIIPSGWRTNLEHVTYTKSISSSVHIVLHFCFFLLWWRAPQQMLRTHRSLKASCAIQRWRWKMISFFIFTSNGAPVEWNWQGKTEVLGGKPVPVPLCPQQTPHGLTRDRTRVSAVEGRRLTAWAVARPFVLHLIPCDVCFVSYLVHWCQSSQPEWLQQGIQCLNFKAISLCYAVSITTRLLVGQATNGGLTTCKKTRLIVVSIRLGRHRIFNWIFFAFIIWGVKLQARTRQIGYLCGKWAGGGWGERNFWTERSKQQERSPSPHSAFHLSSANTALFSFTTLTCASFSLHTSHAFPPVLTTILNHSFLRLMTLCFLQSNKFIDRR